MMQKKGQGLSMSVIIIAAIGLVILVVLIAIFTGRIGGFGQRLAEEEKGLTCAELADNAAWQSSSCGPGYMQLFGVTNSKDLRSHSGQYCCKPEE